MPFDKTLPLLQNALSTWNSRYYRIVEYCGRI
jgi:hypothetical protein